MKSLPQESHAIKGPHGYKVRVEEPEDWEKELVDRALREESLGEQEIWRTLDPK